MAGNAASRIAEAVHGEIYVQESVREDVAIKRNIFAQIPAATQPAACAPSSSKEIEGSILNRLLIPIHVIAGIRSIHRHELV